MVVQDLTGSFLTEYSIYDQVLVQVGDILDRGEDEIAILSLLKSLDIQAKANGGAVFQVYIRCYPHVYFNLDSCPAVYTMSNVQKLTLNKIFRVQSHQPLLFYHNFFSS